VPVKTVTWLRVASRWPARTERDCIKDREKAVRASSEGIIWRTMPQLCAQVLEWTCGRWGAEC
jgi:hypothetical protein